LFFHLVSPFGLSIDLLLPVYRRKGHDVEEIAGHDVGKQYKQPLPWIQRKAVIIMAGDHGVTSEGVSAYPSAVTPQMVHNFLQSGAAINALARYIGAKVIVVDVSVAADIAHPDLLSRKVALARPTWR
jgi:nicotinate-nucleotide--dimethylbenzimidazole phosphoribosyltransferase